MKRLIKSKRGIALLATLVVAAAAAVGAYAYFTSTGSGTGTASVGTDTAFSLSGATTGTLYPGTHENVAITVTNSGGGNQQLGTITLTAIHACVGAGSSWNGTSCTNSGTEATGCEDFSAASSNPGTTDFWMAPIAEGQDLAPGTYSDASASPNTINDGTLYMNDRATSQDSCKNANLTLTLSS